MHGSLRAADVLRDLEFADGVETGPDESGAGESGLGGSGLGGSGLGELVARVADDSEGDRRRQLGALARALAANARGARGASGGLLANSDGLMLGVIVGAVEDDRKVCLAVPMAHVEALLKTLAP